MIFENLTKFNCDRIKRRLTIETKKLGTPILIKRTKYKSDGLNGFIEDGIENVLFQKVIFIKTASANEVIMEGGRKVAVTGNLIIPYEEDIEIKKGDYFEFDKRKYYVLDCVNVNNLNVYFYVNLVGKLDELNGHG